MFDTLTPHPVVPPAGEEPRGLARLWYQLGPGSRERHERARAEAQRTAALRADWQQACHHVGLGLMIYTPSGITVSVPRIVRVDWGTPVSFTVRLRPGQLAADIRAVAPRLAVALGVASLLVTEREAGWVTVVVVQRAFVLLQGDGGGPRDEGPDDPPELRVA